MIDPLVYADASDARYKAAPMISAGWPSRLSANRWAPAVVASMSQALLMSVRNGPGINVLTRTVGPKASASPSVSALSPALAAEYGSCYRQNSNKHPTHD